MPNDIEIFGSEKLGKDGLLAEKGKIFPFHIHCHTYFEMLLYEPFRGRITVNGQSIATEYPLALLMTPADLHSTHINCGTALYHKLCCTEEFLPADTRPSIPLMSNDRETLAFLTPLFRRAYEYREDRAHLATLIRAAVITLQKSGTPLASPRPHPTARLVRDAMHIVAFEFTGDLTLTALASRLSVSPQHLSAVFSETVGVSFRDYLCDKRLRYASSLLLAGEANVTEACFLSGYRNLSHFVRAFQKKFGTSPGRFGKNASSPRPRTG